MSRREELKEQIDELMRQYRDGEIDADTIRCAQSEYDRDIFAVQSAVDRKGCFAVDLSDDLSHLCFGQRTAVKLIGCIVVAEQDFRPVLNQLFFGFVFQNLS